MREMIKEQVRPVRGRLQYLSEDELKYIDDVLKGEESYWINTCVCSGNFNYFFIYHDPVLVSSNKIVVHLEYGLQGQFNNQDSVTIERGSWRVLNSNL